MKLVAPATKTLAKIAELACFLLFIVIGGSASGAGVTIITHGFQTDFGATPVWMEAMANYIGDIASRANGSVAIYKVEIDRVGVGQPYIKSRTFLPQSNPSNNDANPNTEVVVILDWHNIADDALDNDVSTQLVANAFLPFLIQGQVSENGRNFPPFAEMPIHLIGHSRGGSLMIALARLLGESGIWVDQVTTLDPHPVTLTDEGWYAGLRTFENVLFADNYYEDELLTVPDGQTVGGAYNRHLNGSLLGGYGDPSALNIFSRSTNHSDVHLWYHGTVNTDQYASDGEIAFTDQMRTGWYTGQNDLSNFDEEHGSNAGYQFSRLNGRLWEGPFEGYFNSQKFDAGNRTPGNRAPLVRTQADQWPNLIKIRRTDFGLLRPGGAIGVEYIYQSYNQNASVAVYISADPNPFGNGGVKLATSVVTSYPSTLLSTPTVQLSGTIPLSIRTGSYYYLYAKITAANGLSRFSYYPQRIYISPAATAQPQPPVLALAAAGSSSQINLSWSNSSDNVTDFVIEQRKPDGTWSGNFVKTLNSDTTSTSISGLLAKTTYTFRVRARSGSLASSPSNEKSATTKATSVSSSTLTVQAVDLDTNSPMAVHVYTWIGDSTDIQDRTTSFARSFASGTAAKIACFPTAGGKQFKYMQSGDDVHGSDTWSVSMTEDKTVIIAYGLAATTGKTLVSLAIEGPSTVNENSSGSYKARATFSDGTTSIVSGAHWGEDVDYAHFSSDGVLDTSSVSGNRSIAIRADYTMDGVTKSATKTITIRDSVSTQT